MKRRLAEWMRKWADRIDWPGAPKATHLTFTFEAGKGIVIHGLNGEPEPIAPPGCRLWYLNDADYEKAHTEAIDPPSSRIDWSTGAVKRALP